MSSYAHALLRQRSQQQSRDARSPVSTATDLSAAINKISMATTINILAGPRPSTDPLLASLLVGSMPPTRIISGDFEHQPQAGAFEAANHLPEPELPVPPPGFSSATSASAASSSPSSLSLLDLHLQPTSIFGGHLMVWPLAVVHPTPESTVAMVLPTPSTAPTPVVSSVVQHVLCEEVCRPVGVGAPAPAPVVSSTATTPAIASTVFDVNQRRSLFSRGRANGKFKTSMCTNGPLRCAFGSKCNFAHSKDELELFTKTELTQKKPNCLSYLCWHYVVNGQCAYNDNCPYLHDPAAYSRIVTACGRVFCRASSKCNSKLVERLRIAVINWMTQENPLVQNVLWHLRDPSGNDFDETCSFIGNVTPKSIHDIFNLRFEIQNGTEKLNRFEKMAIALLMHQKCPFTENDDSSFEKHLDYTYSESGVKSFLDGRSCNILQKRYFKIAEDGSPSSVKEVPLNPASTDTDAAADIITAVEVVFDVKGATGSQASTAKACNHSLWFDPQIFQSKEECGEVSVNLVHSKPYVFMAPTDDAIEGHDLIHSIMKAMIERGIKGPMPTELRERFVKLQAFQRIFKWPETKSSEESAAALKSMWDHVHSPYICEDGSRTGAIWKSFKENLACVCDEETPQGGSQMPVFRRNKAADRRRRSAVAIAQAPPPSSLPKLAKSSDSEENVVDFLAQYQCAQ